MRRYLLPVLLLLCCAMSAAAREVEIPAIPGSAEEFIALRDQLARTPEGGAAATVAALLAFSQNERVGLQCLTLILDQGNVGRGNVIQGRAPIGSIMYHIERITKYQMWPYLGFAYVKGASAESNYAVSPPYRVVTRRQRNSGNEASGQVKVMVDCYGFRPRPITLVRNDKGIWKADEMSSLFLNVAPPASTRPIDDL
jgi:hypothetical protein